MGSKNRSTKPKRYTTVIIVLILVIGVVDAVFVGVSSDLRSRTYLAGRVGTIAASLPVDDIKALQGDDRDIRTPAYTRLKQRLAQIKGENSDVHFAYLMGQEKDKVFFYADSETPGSEGYSAPGEEYPEASAQLKLAFHQTTTLNEGPIRDRWGVWLSSLAPIIDPKTREVIAVAGIDVPAQDYYWQIALIALVPLLLAAIPVAGLLRDRKLERKEWEIANLKSQFVSIASHELRSPLSGMLWAVQSFLDPNVKNLTEDQRALLQDMYRSTAFSVATINEILDLSIFERGKKIKSQNEPVDLVSVMQSIQNTLRLGAQEKDLDVVMAKTWPETAYTVGDLAALRRAFMNILSNAIKYSFNSSTITIAYRQENKQHIIGVLDRGIGIPKSEQEKVFAGYHRASNASKSTAHGTGLGLFVTKLIIEEHHGKVWVESKENQGTTIYVSLPIK